MSDPAQHLATENSMVDRVAVAVLERDVVHLDKTLSEVKADMKTGFIEMNKKLDDLKDSLASAKIWAMVLYIGMGIGLLTLIGKAFQWI